MGEVEGPLTSVGSRAEHLPSGCQFDPLYGSTHRSVHGHHAAPARSKTQAIAIASSNGRAGRTKADPGAHFIGATCQSTESQMVFGKREVGNEGTGYSLMAPR